MANLEVLPKRLDVLDVNDPKCRFRINIDVLNEAFGVGRAMYAKAVYPDKKRTYFLSDNSNDKLIIWMPKMYGNSSEWKNVWSKDGSEIYEVAEASRHTDWITTEKISDNNILRLVFVKPDPKSEYVFAGVFIADKLEYLNHTYRRVATKVRLIGNPVSKIELIDDNR